MKWDPTHDRYANCCKTWINDDGEELIIQDLREIFEEDQLPRRYRFQVIYKESRSAPLASITCRESESAAVAVVEGLIERDNDSEFCESPAAEIPV